MIERISVVIGLLALAPLTRFWAWDWWVRLVFALPVVALLAATIYDLLPPRARDRSTMVAGVLVVALLAALAPAVLTGRPPDTAGRATIRTPTRGQSLQLTVRRPEAYTDGFVAAGTCTVPRGYRAMILSRAADGSGYWVLSDGILGQCVDDGNLHEWTARRVDPTWDAPGRRPYTIAVVVLRRDLAEQAQIDKAKGEPLKLPRPADSVEIFATRVEP